MSPAVADRPRIRRLALLLAIVTTLGLVGLASTTLHLFAASAFLVLTLLSINRPALLPVMVVGAQVAAGAVLVELDGTGPWMLLPLLMSLVASAELIAALARIDGPVPRLPGAAIRRSAHSATLAGSVYAAVLLVGDPPGLGGSLGAALVLGAGVLLAWVVLREE